MSVVERTDGTRERYVDGRLHRGAPTGVHEHEVGL
jgi:hypothetical protein